MTAEQRLKFALWLKEAEKQNTKLLKDFIVERGPICYRDENQSEYVAEFVPTEKKSYPYESSISVPDEWFRTHPNERCLRENLTVSGLSSALKAAKRTELAQKLANIAKVQVETELRVRRESKGYAKAKPQDGALAKHE